jgi:hypothetical protein
MLRRRLFDEWRQNNDVAISLYYLFLLHLSYAETQADELPSFYEDLERTTTLAVDDLPAIVKYLKRLGAIKDIEKCHLVPEAINIVEDLFKNTFGTCDPNVLRYNGLELQKPNQSESYRVKHWIEKASEEIQELFGAVHGMKDIVPNDLDTRKSKRILMLNCGGQNRILSFMFMSTPGMSKPFEILELVMHENEVLKWRDEQMLSYPNDYKNIIEPHISVIAAISYQSGIAADLRNKGMHSTGPLNFEALTHYFRHRILKARNDLNKTEKEDLQKKNIEIRSKQYLLMLDIIKNDRGGVVSWYRVLRDIEAELQDYYASLSGMDPYWKDEDWLRL